MKPNAKVPVFVLLIVMFVGAFQGRAQISNVPGTIVEWGSDCCCFLTNVLPSLTNVMAIAAGAGPVLGLRSDGFVAGWGCGAYGSLPVNPYYFTNGSVVAVAAGGNHGEVLWADGTVHVWGDMEFGQTDIPSAATNVVAIATGDYNCLGLRADGAVVAWGNYPENFVLPWTNIVAISQGGTHYLGLVSDGTVMAGGYDPTGIWAANVPPGLSNVVAISAGAYANFALKNDGTIFVWGYTNSQEIKIPPGLSNVVAISACHIRNAADGQCLALKSDGTVVAWGDNTYGVTNVPPGLSNVVAITAGAHASLALVGSGPLVQQIEAANLTYGTNGFALSVPTECGKVYALEYKQSLSDPNWTALPLVAGNGVMKQLCDPSTNSQRFYRVRRW